MTSSTKSSWWLVTPQGSIMGAGLPHVFINAMCDGMEGQQVWGCYQIAGQGSFSEGPGQAGQNGVT